MRISVTDAKAQLTELVRRAEDGDDIVLPHRGRAAVRLVPVTAPSDGKSRRELLKAARAAGTTRRRRVRPPPGARISYLAKTDCRNDRRRHLSRGHRKHEQEVI